MNFRHYIVAFFSVLALVACDDSTGELGMSLNSKNEAISIDTASYDVESRSMLAGPVLARSSMGYLGKVRDPETLNYITGDFMAQFNSIEDFHFPSRDSLVATINGKEVRGVVAADSCVIRLYYTQFYGDSAQTMKLTAYEMSKAMNEDRVYYSDFSPINEGYVRDGGIKQDLTYSLTNYLVSKSDRDSSTYTPYISIPLNSSYTDRAGRTHNNYGTYVMQQYYDHPEYFKNAYTFRNNVVPGFFFRSKSGLGSMAYIFMSELAVYFKLQSADSVYHLHQSFWGTQEVLQSTTITNSTNRLNELAQDNSCTYLKTPAGIFTEMTLPVDEVIRGHEADSISAAQLVVPRLNSQSTSPYALTPPKRVLLVPRDSVNSFFANKQINNNINSYLATWGYSSTSTDNTYTFNNIAGMLTTMKNGPRSSANWNKVVLIPVDVTTTSYTNSSGSTTTLVTKLSNEMGLSSTRLVKGESTNSKLKLKVIYSKFK